MLHEGSYEYLLGPSKSYKVEASSLIEQQSKVTFLQVICSTTMLKALPYIICHTEIQQYRRMRQISIQEIFFPTKRLPVICDREL